MQRVLLADGATDDEMRVTFLMFNVLVTLPLTIGRKFKIRRLTQEEGWPSLNLNVHKFISVFGVKVIAQSTVCNKNLQFAANILAQMLDGNEDGLPDDKVVITQLQKHKSALLIFSKKGKLDAVPFIQNHFILFFIHFI